ncbi:sterol desaturase family protein [Thermoleophilia bacterium SCSIO 60948]|nr:sterol desaturase family protein [Thermoleophilia bacterium SCSIO 60948]
METLILSAIPVFFITMGLEALALRHAAKENAEEAAADPGFVGYEAKDTRTSLAMGTGHLAIGAVWKLAMTAIYAAIYLISPFKLPIEAWWTWVILFFADDFFYYWYHRGHHRVRIFWATHVVHHSSQHYNLSTALRQDWSPFTATLFWMPSALFFPPWMILLAIAWNLLYQFTLHTEVIDKYPRPIEFLFNTPSHHRVHHGSQEQYLDRNYGGILIIWDRMFGTFEPEGERVRYGLTKNIETFNPIKVAYGEFAAIWRDVRAARSLRDRLGFMFKGPGWEPRRGTPPEPEGRVIEDGRLAAVTRES